MTNFLAKQKGKKEDFWDNEVANVMPILFF